MGCGTKNLDTDFQGSPRIKGHDFGRAFCFLPYRQVAVGPPDKDMKRLSVLIRENPWPRIFFVFSSPFHKEVSSSTVSAQLRINFRLRLIRDSLRVTAVQA